jgi:hypothetical protein
VIQSLKSKIKESPSLAKRAQGTQKKGEAVKLSYFVHPRKENQQVLFLKENPPRAQRAQGIKGSSSRIGAIQKRLASALRND